MGTDTKRWLLQEGTAQGKKRSGGDGKILDQWKKMSVRNCIRRKQSRHNSDRGVLRGSYNS
jgi:hypothetical protein